MYGQTMTADEINRRTAEARSAALTQSVIGMATLHHLRTPDQAGSGQAQHLRREIITVGPSSMRTTRTSGG